MHLFDLRNKKYSNFYFQKLVKGAGIAYILPMIFVPDSRVDGNGKFRFQLDREDIRVSLRLSFEIRQKTSN